LYTIKGIAAHAVVIAEWLDTDGGCFAVVKN